MRDEILSLQSSKACSMANEGSMGLGPSILSGVAIFVVGALVNHAWNRYRNRLKRVSWSASYLKVAVAAADQAFGTVQVLYDGNPVTNLHTALIQIENRSNADLQEMVVHMACFEGSRILRSLGTVEGSLQWVPFTQGFNQALATAAPENLAYLFTNREYLIPVLNRGAKASFYLLLSRDDMLQPIVTVACTHLGVEFKNEQAATLLFGVPPLQASIFGIAVTFLIILGVSLKVSSTWVAGLIGWLLGLAATIFGVGLVRLWNWVMKRLD